MELKPSLDEALKVEDAVHIESSITADGSGRVVVYRRGDSLPDHCKNDGERSNVREVVEAWHSV